MFVKKIFRRNKAPFRHFLSASNTEEMSYGHCGQLQRR